MSDDAVARVVSVLQAFEDTDLVCGSESDPHGIRVGDIRTLLARLAAAEEDARRMDWLEGEDDREQIAIVERKPLPRSLFRRNVLITRAGIDAARTAERGVEG